MSEKKDSGLFDVRLIQHQRRNRSFDEKNYQTFLQNLPDSEANLEYVTIEETAPTVTAANTPTLTFSPVDIED